MVLVGIAVPKFCKNLCSHEIWATHHIAERAFKAEALEQIRYATHEFLAFQLYAKAETKYLLP